MDHPRTALLTPLERACAYLDAHRMAALFQTVPHAVVFHAGAMHGHAPTMAEAIMDAARSLGWDPGQ